MGAAVAALATLIPGVTVGAIEAAFTTVVGPMEAASSTVGRDYHRDLKHKIYLRSIHPFVTVLTEEKRPMPINNRSSWMAFVLALTAIGAVPEASQALGSSPVSPLANRLNNLSAALQQRANQLPPSGKTTPNSQSDLQAGFANRSGGGGFGNARRGGFANGGGGGGFANVGRGGWADGNAGGSFVNVNNPWRNGWGDGGGFANRGGGGGFVNRW